MIYERATLLEADHIDEVLLSMVELWVIDVLPTPTSYLILPFHEAPSFVRNICSFNGGDEDWLVLCRKEPQWLPSWLERIDSGMDADVYRLNKAIVYVGSHS